ncbi:MAG TPA: hypothetical protein VHB74_12870, partial [Devosia sp.]|nr:hypothetical protein [Devosia sp.]
PPGAAEMLPKLPSVAPVPDEIPSSDTTTPTNVLPSGNVVDVAPSGPAVVDSGTSTAPVMPGAVTPSTTAPAIVAPGTIAPGGTAPTTPAPASAP